jgi:hypothetical protein
MFTRPWPPFATTSVTPARASTTPPRANVSRATAPPPTGLAPTTTEELVSVLLRGGARVISRQLHGVLLKVRQRLVFIPATPRVPESTLADALRTAGLTPEQFVELRAALS